MLRAGTVAAPPGRRLRTALSYAALVRVAALAAAPLAGRLPDGARARMERAWGAAMRRALGMRLRAEGLENVRPGRQYVVAPLHESVVDPIALLALPLPMRWVLRDEIATWPDVGPYLRRSPHAAIRPEAGTAALRALLRAGADAFAAGASLVVFPQGTLLGIETAFAPGAAIVSARLGRPLLPVVLTGSHRVWEHPFSPVLRFGQPVGLRVLPAVAADEALGRFRGVEVEMKRQALAGDLPPPRRFAPERDGWWDGYRYEIDPAYPRLAARVAAHRGE